jgi:DNA-binding CsgD family transcriptional regulator
LANVHAGWKWGEKRDELSVYSIVMSEDERVPAFDIFPCADSAADDAYDLRGVSGFDFLTFGMIFVDARAEVVEMNRVAARLIGDGLKVERRRLSTESRRETQQLRSLVERCAGDPEHSTAAMTVTRRLAEGPLEILVSALTDRNVALTRSAAAVVFVNEPSRRSAPDAAFLRDTLGLSPCEIRLVAHLVAGQTIEEAARELHVTPNTARTHLKSIFLKTGVRRQSELIRRISNSLATLVRRED